MPPLSENSVSKTLAMGTPSRYSLLARGDNLITWGVSSAAERTNAISVPLRLSDVTLISRGSSLRYELVTVCGSSLVRSDISSPAALNDTV